MRISDWSSDVCSSGLQNLLTAARTLSQVNNQIRSLQNEAQMLAGQAKNLARIDFPQLDRLREKLGEIDRLMGQAQGIDFRVDQLDERYRQLFPDSFAAAMTSDEQIAAAKQGPATDMTAFRQAMKAQSGIGENGRGAADATRYLNATRPQERRVGRGS